MIYPHLLRSRVALVTTLFLAAAVGIATLTPIPQSVEVGGSDKLHHVIGFGALMLPVAALRPRWIPVTAIALAFYGAAIEIVQPYVGRHCEFADWTADVAGIILGAVTGFILNRLVRAALGLPPTSLPRQPEPAPEA